MKQFLLLFSLFFIYVQSIKAQDYLPLIQENATWVVSFDDVEGTPWLDTWHSYQIREDTTVNGVDYKKVYYRDLAVDNVAHEVIYPYQYYNEQLYGLIREDIAERKVYYLKLNDEQFRPTDCPTGEEIILYDFNMTIGTEQDFCHFFNDMPAVLTQIDTIGTQWGSFPSYYWTEGEILEQLGSLYGLLETPIPNVSGYWESLYDYCIGSDETCDFISSTKEIINAKNRPTASPNPFDNQLTINNLSNWKILKIYDALGREMWRNVDFLEEVKVPEKTFPTSGIYYLQVENETQITTVKIVKT